MSEIKAVMNVWGRDSGLVPAFLGREPDARKGDRVLVYFCDTEEAAREAESRLHQSALHTVVAVETEHPAERTVALVTLRWKGTDWQIEQDFGYGYPAESARYMFSEGNYSCDCNRTIFLRERYPDAGFPDEEKCGHEIEMVRFVIERRAGERHGA
jgi:hypothetical protein